VPEDSTVGQAVGEAEAADLLDLVHERQSSLDRSGVEATGE
jgi:hypothetical protein